MLRLKNILAEKMHANVSREFYMLITLVHMCALKNPGSKNWAKNFWFEILVPENNFCILTF